MSRRKLKPHPDECYVYCCVTCGSLEIAHDRPHQLVNCSRCPPGAGDVRGLKYVPKLVKPRSKRP